MDIVLIADFLRSAFLWFLMIAATLLSIGSLFFPRKLWELTDSWKAKRQPSNAYFFMQRIAGLIGLIASIALWYMLYLIHTLG